MSFIVEYVYGGATNIERTVNMHLIGLFLKTPGIKYIYHSKTDWDEKSFCLKLEAIGKAYDYIFWGNGHEIGIGENTGPTHQDHHKKSVTNFVDLIHVQHINEVRRKEWAQFSFLKYW